MAQSINDYLKSYGVDPNERYSNEKTTTSSSKKKSSSSKSSPSKSSSSKSLSSNSNRYTTTVTRKDGTTASGYIENGKSYYSDGTRISAGDSVTDAQGKVWTMGGNSDPDAGLSMNDYLAKYGVSNSASNSNKKVYYDEDDDYEREESENPYDAYKEYMQKQYEEQQRAIEEQNRLAVEQGVNRLNAQRTNINQSADDNARQAYIMHMQQRKALPQQLASQGVSGGATETANLGLASDYQNNVNTINQNRANSIQDIDNAIVDLQNTGDLNTVEQVLSNNQAALDAYREAFNQQQDYNKWATEFNANRKDTSWEQAYKEQAYKDSMTQQELENQWYERNYSDSKKQEETNRILTMLQNGLVDVNYASTLLGVPANQINNFVDYINKSRQLEQQKAQADISNTYANANKKSSTGEGKTTSPSTINSILNTANKMLNEREDVFGDGSIYRNVYGEEDVLAYILAQNISAEEKKNMVNGLGLGKYMQ